MRGEYAEAEQLLRSLLERAANDRRLNPLEFIANLAVVCARQGKLAEAEQFHREALTLVPNDPGLWNSLAWFLADHRLNLDEALSLARRAVEVAPGDPNFLDTLGWVHFQRGDLEEAQRILQRALDLAGNSPSAIEIGEHLRQVMQRPGVDKP
jgi:Flp pilus assembly protein TadD